MGFPSSRCDVIRARYLLQGKFCEHHTDQKLPGCGNRCLLPRRPRTLFGRVRLPRASLSVRRQLRRRGGGRPAVANLRPRPQAGGVRREDGRHAAVPPRVHGSAPEVVLPARAGQLQLPRAQQRGGYELRLRTTPRLQGQGRVRPGTTIPRGKVDAPPWPAAARSRQFHRRTMHAPTIRPRTELRGHGRLLDCGFAPVGRR
mmetsp:Transcript_2884/g.7329  ORF Transcript_2884/g.7329 Transcript_2884/m.7329 type:complete len:201 (+) Transcript_2884:518-1120(+)